MVMVKETVGVLECERESETDRVSAWVSVGARVRGRSWVHAEAVAAAEKVTRVDTNTFIFF